VVTDATKKLREPVAYILLAFAGLVALASLIRLFVGSEFTSSAGVVQGTLTPPGLTALVLLAALVGAVWLVTEAGERTPNARTVTLAALAIAGLIVLLGLITAFAGFGETGDAGLKLVGFLYALGGLALYGAVGLFLVKTFRSFPAPVRAPKGSQHGQFAGQGQQYPQQSQYGAQYGQPGQYGQQGQYGAAQGQYGQPEQYSQYGTATAAGAGAVGGYAAGQAEGQWPQQEQGWNQGEQQAWPPAGEAQVGNAEQAGSQPAEQAWPAEGHGGDTGQQQWTGQDAGQQQWTGQESQQWPQQEQQWTAESGQQQWAAQEQQYAQQGQPEWQGQPQQGQPEWQQSQPQQGEQAWPQQGWQQQGGQWPPAEEAPAAEPGAAPVEAAAADETRIEPRVEEEQKSGDDPQGGQTGQQGWWSQPS
jgi:hypothetical protein